MRHAEARPEPSLPQKPASWGEGCQVSQQLEKGNPPTPESPLLPISPKEEDTRFYIIINMVRGSGRSLGSSKHVGPRRE